MKQAYEYRRISQEDQSNFSLSGQGKLNLEFAKKHDINIVETFIDDGYSAKNFDRPEWQRLEKFLSKNRSKIDYLIVSKYDRLIRNAAEGLAFIERLEQKWNIKLLSVMENFFIDPHSPFFFKMRADMLVNAEFERRVISDRSKFGIWSAKTQGRFIGPAPTGYINARDEKDHPVILVDRTKTEIIQQAFEDFINDTPFPMIMNKMREAGIKLNGHDSLKRMLSNHAYAGLLIAPAYKDEKQKVVKATHEAIISEDMFWRSYYKMQDNIRPQGPKIVDDNVPLRGFLMCESCGGYLTGGPSQGKSKVYFYYRCKKCNGQNHSANKVHNEVSEILTCLSLKKSVIEAVQIEAEKQLKEGLSSRLERSKRVSVDYNRLKEKLDALEEKYITDKIEQETYSKWRTTYLKDIESKSKELKESTKNEDEVRSLYKNNLQYLTDLNWIYNQGTVESKQALLKGIMPGGLTKEKQGGRTPYLNDLFYVNSLSIQHLLRIGNKNNDKNSSDFPIVPEGGMKSNTIEGFLRVIEQILKKAA